MGWPRFMASNWALRQMMFPTPRPKPQRALGKEPNWVCSREPWEETPKWHPMRWLFGLDVRYIGYNWTDEAQWVYDRSEKVARELLEREYDIPEATDRDHDMIFGNDGHGNL